MSETDRAASAIKDFFDSEAASDDLSGVSEVVQHVVIDAWRRTMELAQETEEHHNALEERQELLTKIQEDAVELAKNPPAEADRVQAVTDLVMRAMVARRATYDLTNPDRPWEQLTPAEAMESEDDMYAYVIVDTVVEKIEKLQNGEEEEEYKLKFGVPKDEEESEEPDESDGPESEDSEDELSDE